MVRTTDMHLMMGRFKIICWILLISILKGRCDDKTEITFKYITSYLKKGQIMTKDDIGKSSVNVLKPITFIIGNGSYEKDSNWSEKLADAYVNRYISNVFMVGRDAGSSPGPSVATPIADFIMEIYDRSGEAYLDIHLVGVGSGCDVAALTVENLDERIPSRKISRITCLDPIHYGRNIPLDNVNFADVVFSGVKGGQKYVGDVVFYIDGKCDKDVCKIPISIAMFAESVNSNHITATPCDSIEHFREGGCAKEKTVVFGENINKTTRGEYYLKI